MDEAYSVMLALVVGLAHFGAQVLEMLGRSRDLNFSELLTLNAIGIAFGVLGIQIYADVVLKQLEQPGNPGSAYRSRSRGRIQRLTQGLMWVAGFCGVSIFVAMLDQSVAPAIASGQASDRITVPALAKTVTVIAVAIAFFQLASFLFAELIWPDQRVGARYAASIDRGRPGGGAPPAPASVTPQQGGGSPPSPPSAPVQPPQPPGPKQGS